MESTTTPELPAIPPLPPANGSTLIGECDICGNITAIDLDDTPEHWKEMQHPGRTVKRLPKDEALALWRERGKRCDHKALIAELRARVAPNNADQRLVRAFARARKDVWPRCPKCGKRLRPYEGNMRDVGTSRPQLWQCDAHFLPSYWGTASKLVSELNQVVIKR